MPENSKAPEMPSIFMDKINLRTTPFHTPRRSYTNDTYERPVGATPESGCVHQPDQPDRSDDVR
jgi:hypothetical protein